MKAVLEFNLPEEGTEHRQAVFSQEAYSALWDISQEIFRPARKHGYQDSRIQKLIDHLDSVGENSDTVDRATATELIGKLETLFWEILARYKVEL